ncbi:zinc finger protein 813-like [Synchiropus splendidus]|uniref:zinc finger protein 813-like n=1 Tax=Synchiropus splendidus TaxID=270530 RepID=UPI00237D8C2C|nr:zinc finger protein 813-like [Synchiropus splendidus]
MAAFIHGATPGFGLGSEPSTMSVVAFQQFVSDRLAAAAREIFGMFELTVTGLQDEVDRQRKLLDVVLKPSGTLPPQEWSSIPHRQEPDPPLTGEKEGEEEDKKEDVPQLAFNIVSVRSEDESAPSSQLPHIKTEEEERDGRTGSTSYSCSLPHSDHQRSLYSESDTSHIGDWGGTSCNPSASNSAKTPDVSEKGEGKSVYISERGRTYPNHSQHLRKKSFSCTVCGKVFSSKAHFQIHMRIHTGEKPFCCTECGKCFNQRENMKRHMRTHTGERPFNCSVCGKSFTDSGDVRKHMRIHTAEKSFSCPECGKLFNQAALLKAHLRRHTEEKPFECPLCGKCFRERGNMKIHMRTHTGEKPFSCSECGKQFTQKSNLKTHMKVHMRNDGLSLTASALSLFPGNIPDLTSSQCFM